MLQLSEISQLLWDGALQREFQFLNWCFLMLKKKSAIDTRDTQPSKPPNITEPRGKLLEKCDPVSVNSETPNVFLTH